MLSMICLPEHIRFHFFFLFLFTLSSKKFLVNNFYAIDI